MAIQIFRTAFRRYVIDRRPSCGGGKYHGNRCIFSLRVTVYRIDDGTEFRSVGFLLSEKEKIISVRGLILATDQRNARAYQREN